MNYIDPTKVSQAGNADSCTEAYDIRRHDNARFLLQKRKSKTLENVGKNRKVIKIKRMGEKRI